MQYKVFKFRCYPTKTQEEQFIKTFNARRFIWNYFVSIGTKETISSEFSLSLTKLKGTPEYSWLNDISSVALQNMIPAVMKAFRWAKVKPELVKKKQYKNYFTISGTPATSATMGKITVPKTKGYLSIKWTRVLPKQPTTYKIGQSKDGKFWIQFVCKDTGILPTCGTGVVGIDLGLKDIVVDSDKNVYKNPRYLSKAKDKISKAHRKFSRRITGSKRKEKARLSLAKRHSKVANQRKDYIHKLTRKLINENQVIGIEDLNIRKMTTGNKFSGLVLDTGLRFFRECLEYKARESGWTVIVRLNRWEPSTQYCHSCQTRVKKKFSMHVREWRCEFCGALHDRDVNASLNIKRVAKFIVDTRPVAGGTLVLAPPLLSVLSNMPRTVVCAQ